MLTGGSENPFTAGHTPLRHDLLLTKKIFSRVEHACASINMLRGNRRVCCQRPTLLLALGEQVLNIFVVQAAVARVVGALIECHALAGRQRIRQLKELVGELLHKIKLCGPNLRKTMPNVPMAVQT